MRWLNRLFKALVLLAVAVWTFLFTLENTDPVVLDLVALELPARSLGFWVIVSFVLGGLTGLLAGSLMFFNQKRREIRIRRDLRQSRNELASERSARGTQLALAAESSDQGVAS